MADAVVLEGDDRAAARAITGLWWVFLVTGILWLLVALLVLRFTNASITTVGVILGIVFLGATLNEFMLMALAPGWKWLHGAMGVVFGAGAIYCFVNPQNAFWALASVIGLLFVLKGAMDLVIAAATKNDNELWWLGLVTGILMILIGFWASQQFYPARAALILLWVGFFAMFRGISEIVIAFAMRKVGHALD